MSLFFVEGMLAAKRFLNCAPILIVHKLSGFLAQFGFRGIGRISKGREGDGLDSLWEL